MRVEIDLGTDRFGRPVGVLRTPTSADEPFSDWLELLRALESCVDDAYDHRKPEGA